MRRVLIANRGEIAVRVIRACQELGLETVAIHSDADSNAPHVKMADRAFRIGPPRPTESYLVESAIVQVARESGCDAVHPGYGFLSERASFAQACIDANLTFVGPSPKVISAMGDKVSGRRLAAEHGVPIVEGTRGGGLDLSDMVAFAGRAGYPMLLKAAAGGGGRGMRIVRSSAELQTLWSEAQAEARAAFGDPTVYAERYHERVRHVEVQIIGDHHGHVIHLGTRDCTLQRRHQKIVEEAPACVPAEVSERMCSDAIRLATHVGYVGAGTIEFVFDVNTQSYYFIEANTRLQVEHPVTEMTTGLDVVREQLHVADSANRLSLSQKDIQMRGHAIEMRICAEDPARNFFPSPGTIKAVQWPGGPGVRLDTHVGAGYVVSPYYDSMIAKIVVHDSGREQALRRAVRALGETKIEGPANNVDFLRRLLSDTDVQSNDIFTTWLERNLERLRAVS